MQLIKLGIPYKGNKNKLAERLIKRMLEIKPNAKYFYDLFGGGGAMSLMAMQMGLKVFYNEIDTKFYLLLKHLLKKGINKDWYNFIDRETFFKCKDEPSIFGAFVSCCYSFGNDCKTYLYSKEIEQYKKTIHNAVVFDIIEPVKQFEPSFNGFKSKDIKDRRLEWRKFIKTKYLNKTDGEIGKLQQVQALERLEQLERLQNIKRIEKLQNMQNLQNIERIEFTNSDYRLVLIDTPIDETIVYCDIPYFKTNKYKQQFDYNSFYNWFRENKYSCFLSEYQAPFESVLEVEHRSTLSATNNSKKTIEKLFYNGR